MGQRIKCILIGYPGSQRIVPASKYLTEKYLPEFDTIYLNYQGPIEGWASYVLNFLRYLTDETVIFALDDYLIASPIHSGQFEKAKLDLCGDVVCVKLCMSTDQEHEEYPVTTQYCLWNREFLIRLLLCVQTPWQFEIGGSKIFNGGSPLTQGKKSIVRTCINYFTNSSLSGRWEGVRLDGLIEEDIKFIKDNDIIS